MTVKKWRWLYSGNVWKREVRVTAEHYTEEEARRHYPPGRSEYSLLDRCPETEIEVQAL